MEMLKKRPVSEVIRKMKVGDVEKWPISQKNSVRNTISEIRLIRKNIDGSDYRFKGSRSEDSKEWIVRLEKIIKK